MVELPWCPQSQTYALAMSCISSAQSWVCTNTPYSPVTLVSTKTKAVCKPQCDLDDCGTRTPLALLRKLGRHGPQELLLDLWETY